MFMLNKFEFGEAVLSNNDPRRKLQVAWEQFLKDCRQNMELLIRCGRKRSFSEFEGDPSYQEVDFEAEIIEKAPSLAESMVELRRALDAVEGWRITWRHPELRRQWETVEVPSETIPGVLEEKSIRAPLQFHHNEGWVKGSKVGSDLTGVSPIVALIQIGSSQEATNGIYISLGEMFYMELTPPEKSA